jgi:hypothetical protein
MRDASVGAEARVRDASVGAEASGDRSWNVQSGRYKKPARLRYIRGLPRTSMETNKQTLWGGVCREKLVLPQQLRKFPSVWNLEVCHRIHRSSPLFPVMIHTNQLHIFPPHFFIVRTTNIKLPSASCFFRWSLTCRFSQQVSV